MTQRHHKFRIVGGVSVVLAISVSGLAMLPADAANGQTYDASAVTKVVKDGPFGGLSVSVAKTDNLINEVIEVTWSGGKPSTPSVSTVFTNYLQIMQCWGEDAAGPSPEQCQYGGLLDKFGSEGSRKDIASRRVQFAADSLPKDPAEPTRPKDSLGDAFVPFTPAAGDPVGGKFDEHTPYFDGNTTNEIPLAPTRGDGTGQEFFEAQTTNEAPGLGCGAIVSPQGKPVKARNCWLVIVPRSDLEVDGKSRQPGVPAPGDRLVTSPLSASNWAHRMAFPLRFQPLGGACPEGQAAMSILGHESATEAITRWQPSLCSTTGEVFSYSQLTDAASRSTLMGTKPTLSVMTKPAGKPSTGSAVYAPISISGLGFAYLLEVKRPDESEPLEVQQRAGQRVTDLKLTPRLVAKLLSQSYQKGVTVLPDAMKNNPVRLERDPEFLDLNPSMAAVNKVDANAIWTIVTPLTPSDATQLVWQWIAADSEARDFLSGKDDRGMVVNPEWKAANLGADDFAVLKALDSFTKLDQACKPAFTYGGGEGQITEGPLCVSDAFPYSNDMHEAVLAANKGDTLARNSWQNQSIPPIWGKGTSQPKGSRGIMVVSDSATAARYNLPMAALRNANGKFVRPDAANLLANVGALKPSTTKGVLAPDANVKVDAAYPLTVISYASTVPAALTAAERMAYAGFVNYAIGPGQKPGVAPGSLPTGYAPLPKGLVDTARAAATAIKNYKAPAAPRPTPNPTPKPAKSGGGGDKATDGNSAGSEPPLAGGEPPAATPPDTTFPEPSAPAVTPNGGTPADMTPRSTGFTPTAAVGNTARYSLLGLLVIALLAVLLSRAVPQLGAIYGISASQRPRPAQKPSGVRNPVPGSDTADRAWQAPGGPRGDA